MQTETQQRIKIAERPIILRARMNAAQRVISAAEDLAHLYAGLEMGDFDAAALADVFVTGGEETRRRWLDIAKEEAKRIPGAAIRAQLIKGIEEAEPPYIVKAKQIKAISTYDEVNVLDYLTVTNEGATLTEEAAARLAEDSHVYITDPEEIELYHKHTAAVEALNDLFGYGKNAPVIWYSVFEMGEDGVIKIPSQGVNYAYLLNLGRDREAKQTGQEQPQKELTKEQPQKELTQHNATKVNAPRMVVGIAKDPDYRDRGAELRLGESKASPDSPE